MHSLGDMLVLDHNPRQRLDHDLMRTCTLMFYAMNPSQEYFKDFTLSPPNELSSAKFLICFNFQSFLISLKVYENVVRVS